MFKRKINPIFVEDEQYNWGGRRSGFRVILAVIVLCVLVGAVLILV